MIYHVLIAIDRRDFLIAGRAWPRELQGIWRFRTLKNTILAFSQRSHNVSGNLSRLSPIACQLELNQLNYMFSLEYSLSNPSYRSNRPTQSLNFPPCFPAMFAGKHPICRPLFSRVKTWSGNLCQLARPSHSAALRHFQGKQSQLLCRLLSLLCDRPLLLQLCTPFSNVFISYWWV